MTAPPGRAAGHLEDLFIPCEGVAIKGWRYLFLLKRQVDGFAVVEHLDAMGGVVGREQHTTVHQCIPLHVLVLRLNRHGPKMVY